MIGQLRDDTGGIRGLGKVEKVYLDNTNLAYLLGHESADIGNIRETFFYNQMRVKTDVISSRISDFEIDGKNRSRYKMRPWATLSKTTSKQAMATSSPSGNLDSLIKLSFAVYVHNWNRPYCVCYYNWKGIGMMHFTLTFLSHCLPGIHLGISLTIRNASLSKAGFTLFTTLIFVSLPLLSTTKSIITRP